MYFRCNFLSHDYPPCTSQDISSLNYYDPPNMDNVDLPISIRKWLRSCSMHHTSKYVLDNKLDTNVKRFIVALSASSIPMHHQHDLLDPK